MMIMVMKKEDDGWVAGSVSLVKSKEGGEKWLGQSYWIDFDLRRRQRKQVRLK